MKPTPEQEKWVVVAEFTAFDLGVAADLAVSKLRGSGIPTERLPTGSITIAIPTGMPGAELIRVLVPADQADRARDVLADEVDTAEPSSPSEGDAS